MLHISSAPHNSEHLHDPSSENPLLLLTRSYALDHFHAASLAHLGVRRRRPVEGVPAHDVLVTVALEAAEVVVSFTKRDHELLVVTRTTQGLYSVLFI